MTSDGRCQLCNGTQWRYSDDGEVAKQCICLVRKRRRAFLGPLLSEVQHVKSHLYDPQTDEAGVTTGDRTADNLFIRGAWDVVSSHLKWVLGGKYYYEPNFSFLIVDDDRLLRVWLGDEHAKNSSPDAKRAEETVNNLRDLVEGPSLLIVRLGVVRWNKAAGRVLHEAMLIREYAMKPTWIVEGIEPFGPGHTAYDADIGTYVREKFEVIDLGGDVERERKRLVWEGDTDTVAMGAGIETPRRLQGPRPKDDLAEDTRLTRKAKSARPRRGGGPV